ncbi:AMP-binding protein, partial [Burkholderia sp. Ax-1720]|nr:AMP-binding protein [Burkholderia sp. Ax-1720]
MSASPSASQSFPSSPPTAPLDTEALLAALPARIAELPRRIAARTPEHPALIEDARRLSYAELVTAIDAGAAQLRA